MKDQDDIARDLLEDASDEDIMAELQRLADQPRCPPSVREHTLGVLHEHQMEQHTLRATAARAACDAALLTLKKTKKRDPLRSLIHEFIPPPTFFSSL